MHRWLTLIFACFFATPLLAETVYVGDYQGNLFALHVDATTTLEPVATFDSPGKRQIAHIVCRPKTTQIYAFDLYGVAILDLANDVQRPVRTEWIQDFGQHPPQFTPDGRRLVAHIRFNEEALADPATNGSDNAIEVLAVLDPDTLVPEFTVDHIGAFAISPDGRQLIYATRESILSRDMNTGATKTIVQATGFRGAIWQQGEIVLLLHNNGTTIFATVSATGDLVEQGRTRGVPAATLHRNAPAQIVFLDDQTVHVLDWHSKHSTDISAEFFEHIAPDRLVTNPSNSSSPYLLDGQRRYLDKWTSVNTLRDGSYIVLADNPGYRATGHVQVVNLSNGALSELINVGQAGLTNIALAE